MLFPYEVSPMTAKEIEESSDEYVLISDGRYLPKLEILHLLYDQFGSRVTGSNYEEIFNDWIKNS
jgi:hypothetical protein